MSHDALITDNYVRYTITYEEKFSKIEYKVLCSQSDSRLLRCYQVNCNGNQQLLFNVQQFHSLRTVLKELSSTEFYQVMAEICSIYDLVKANGFMETEHLMYDLDMIYVTQHPLRLRMIYLPVQLQENQRTEHENDLVHNLLLEMIQTYQNSIDAGVFQLKTDIEQKKESLKELETRLVSGFYEQISQDEKIKEQERIHIQNQRIEKLKKRKLVLKNDANNFVLTIANSEYVIGKKAGVVDGYIPDHPTVSRIHCKIIYNDEKNYIMDLGSVNGTTVNGIKCYPNIAVPINDGDQITISNLVFYYVEEK